RRGDECRIDQRLHGVRDLCAIGDVFDGLLHQPVAHPLADGVQDGAADLILVADLGEDLGCLHRVDLPANRHLDVHPHLLAGERFDRLDLLATRGPLLFARRVALDRRPGGTNRMPANRGDWSTYPNACRTPTSPGSMTTTREPAPTTVPRTATASPATRRRLTMGPGRCERRVAAPSRRKNAMPRRTAPATSLPMETPERDAGEDAPRAELRKEVRSPPARSGLPVSGPLR